MAKDVVHRFISSMETSVQVLPPSFDVNKPALCVSTVPFLLAVKLAIIVPSFNTLIVWGCPSVLGGFARFFQVPPPEILSFTMIPP